jgi:membrane protein YdbS with pleckstrin-like domain
MNCCGNHDHNSQDHGNVNQGNENGHGTHQHNHNLMMAVCYIIPIAVILGLFFTGGFSGSNSLLILAAVLICPLMHMFMMPAMMKKGNGHHH